MADKPLSFKEMCARFDVTPRTLRYYEYIELLSPEREGRSRWYTPREVARMTLILRGRRFGFSLEEIRQWLELYDQGGTETQNRALMELAATKLTDLRSEIAQMEAAAEELQQLHDRVAQGLVDAS